MWRSEKAGYLKDGRDYSSLLDDPVEDCGPSREKQDFLRRRQKLEELLKSKQKNRSSSSRPDPGSSRGRSEAGSSSQRSREDLPFDKTFGSFFGPSEPVLARSYVERQRNRDDSSHAAARLAKQKQAERKSSATSSSKPVLKSKLPARPVTKTKQKAQKLKEARDYSFLFSEDGDAAPKVKAPAKERTGYDRQPGPSKSAKDSSRPVVSSSANRKQASQPPPKQQSRAGGTIRRPLDQSRQVKGSSGRDNERQRQPVLSRSSIKEPSRSVLSANQKVSRPSDASRKPFPSGSSIKQKPLPSSSRLPEKRSSTSSKPVDTKRPLSTNQLKRPAPVAKRPEYDRQPAKRSKREESPASSFLDDDEDSYENYRSLLPPQFRMKSRRVPDDDDYDSSDMEVGFSTIQQEEARSARIAREEDERERVLIEEEERLERERLRRKQRR